MSKRGDGLPKRIWAALGRRSARIAKTWKQRATLPKQETKLGFVLGCQRSGTTMMLDTLSLSPEVMAYGETEGPPMDRHARLRDETVIRRLLANSPAHLVGLKPICDSHWADRLLETYEDGRAIWMYRRYEDVVNSSLRQFSSQLEVVQAIGENRWEKLGWRVERRDHDDPDIQLIQRCYKNATRVDAAAIQWLMRSRLYLKLGLEGHPRVRLVRYERLVEDPLSVGAECFDFLRVRFDEEFVASIHRGSVSKNEPPEMMAEIREQCEALQEELDRSHERQLAERAAS